MRALFVVIALTAGCYRSHQLAGGDDAGPPDAGPRDAGSPDAGPLCAPIAHGVDVMPGSCTELVVPTTAGNVCLGPANHAASIVRVRRSRDRGPWSVLIRARSDATQISYGRVDPADCNRCDFEGSVTGGDLRAHGVGGGLPDDLQELDLIIDGQGGAIWLRLCDPPL
jgi:hypothetical protein